MDLTNGKPLSPWKVPSKISLKRIRHKINSDLIHSPHASTNAEKNASKSNPKKNRLVINKFALARSISTPTSDENQQQPNPTESSSLNDEHLLAKLHQIIPPQPSTPDHLNYNSTMKQFSFDPTPTPSNSSNLSSSELLLSYPEDWSLKSFARFSTENSSKLFNQLTKLRSSDESQSLEYICSITSIENDKAYFRSLTSYWIYPHLPWMKLFPRSNQEQSQQNSSNPLDESSQHALQNEWKLAFQSLYQSFRTKFNSFFYFCTQTFQILFREDSSDQLIAIINPTTTGFRSTLEKEGIEYSMADGGDLLNNSLNKGTEEDPNEEENSDETDESCEQWLETIGLSHSTSTTDSSIERKPFRNSRKILSKKAQSRSTTILIRGISSVNSLFNFLLNKSERLCIPLTGPLIGIPPTLISPRPFLYSTLKYLNLHIQSDRILTLDGGPILPDRLKNLWNFFQEKEKHIQLNCLHAERTSSFNLHSSTQRTIKQILINELNQILLQSFQSL